MSVAWTHSDSDGIERAVAVAMRGGRVRIGHRARDAGVEPVQPRDLCPGRGRRAVHDPQVRAERPGQAAPRVGAEVGVLGDALGDERVRDLEQERPRAGTEEERRLAVVAPAGGARAVEAIAGIACRGLGQGQRSLGRRPTTHHAAGNTAAAARSLTMSITRNGSRPNSIAHRRLLPVVTASHGTPIA